MTQQDDLLKLAKQGNPRAIEALINPYLQARSITAKASLKDGVLQVLLESADVPNQQLLVDFIRNGITKLGAASIQKVKVYGKQTSEVFPAWSQEFELVTRTDYTLSKTKSVMPKTSSIQPIVTIQPLRKISNTARQQKPGKKNKIIAITSLGTFILLLGSFTGLIFWHRSVQSQTLVKAQTLLAKVEDTNNVSDINSLKAAQEQITQVVTILDNAPNLPLLGSIYQNIQAEKKEIITRLDSVAHNIKMIEQLEPEIRLVMDEFSAVSSRLDVGTNYVTYREQVGELKVAFDRFTRQTGSKNHPVYEKLTDAFKDYNFALEMWRYYIESDDASHDFFPASSSYGIVAITEYQVEPKEIYGEDYIHLDTAISQIWMRANKHLEVAHKQVNSKNENNNQPINTKVKSSKV